MSGEKLSGSGGGNAWDNIEFTPAPGQGDRLDTEHAALNTHEVIQPQWVEPVVQNVDYFSGAPTISGEKGGPGRGEDNWNISTEAQQANLEKRQEEKQVAGDTLESIINHSENWQEGIDFLATAEGAGARAEFLRDFDTHMHNLMAETKDDFSPEASAKVNLAVFDYCQTLSALDDAMRKTGDPLVGKYDQNNIMRPSDENSGFTAIENFMQKRRANECDTKIPNPSLEQLDENAPKADAAAVMAKLSEKLTGKIDSAKFKEDFEYLTGQKRRMTMEEWKADYDRRMKERQEREQSAN